MNIGKAVDNSPKDTKPDQRSLTGERIVCNVCDQPGTFSKATDIAQVHSNIRKFRNEVFTVWRCSNCGTLHSKESVDLDHYYAYYPITGTCDLEDPSAGQVDVQPFERLIYSKRLQTIRRHGFDSRARVLDYGCNRGAFVAYLHLRGYKHALGFDPYQDPYKDASLLQRTYDVITTQDVIEHVTEPRETLSQLVSCLSTNGILIIGTPNAADIELAEAEGKWNFELHQPYHRQILTEDVLVNLAENFGLQVKMIQRRWTVDTPFPFVNANFVANYVRHKQNIVDAIVSEPVDFGTIIRHPMLLVYGFAGYFLRRRGNMMIVLAK